MRSLKIPSELAELIKRYKLWQDDYKASIGNKWIESNRLFTQWDGKPMDPPRPTITFRRSANGIISDFAIFTASDI